VGTEKGASVPCQEPLVVTPTATNCGSWSTPCHQYVEVDCPNTRCYWYDRADERKSVTLTELRALQREHDKYARHRAAEDERERVRQGIAALKAEASAVHGGSDVCR